LPDPGFEQALAAHRAGRLGEAVNLYRETIARDPRNAGALHNLGLILLRRGNPAEAEQLFRQAITLAPTEAMFHVALSNALRTSGDLGGARTSAEHALRLRPALVDAWYSLASTNAELGAEAEAEAAYGKLLSLDQRHADGIIGLGTLRLQQGRLDAAEQAFGNAIRLRPNHPLAYIRLGDVFVTRDRTAGAVEAYRRARALDPGSLEAEEKYHAALAQSGGTAAVRTSLEQAVARDPASPKPHELLADFLSAHGFIADAADSYRRALALDPQSTTLHLRLAQTKKFAPGDPDLAALEAAYAAQPPSGDSREALAFALGKALDDTGDFARAFSFYLEGNRLRRSQIDYALEAEARSFAATMATFTRDFIDRRRGEGDPSEIPIFIVGMPRSGTTLTEQILSAASGVYAAGELDFIRKASIAVLGFEPFTGAARLADPDTALDLAAIGRTYLGWLPAAARSSRRATDKLPQNFRYLGLIRLIFPNAKIIHVHRDPLDNCLSLFKGRFAGSALGFSYDLTELGRYYNLYRDVMRHWHEVMPGDIFDLGYEELVSDPQATSQRLFDHCGLPWTPDVLAVQESRREVRTASFAQVRQPINRDSLKTADRYGPALDPLRAALAEWDGK
jgi:Tfp pilus assembly protein PilF